MLDGGISLDLSPDLVALESAVSFSAVVSDQRETPVKVGGSGRVKTERLYCLRPGISNKIGLGIL